jgi:hypothetical protein
MKLAHWDHRFAARSNVGPTRRRSARRRERSCDPVLDAAGPRERCAADHDGERVGVGVAARAVAGERADAAVRQRSGLAAAVAARAAALEPVAQGSGAARAGEGGDERAGAAHPAQHRDEAGCRAAVARIEAARAEPARRRRRWPTRGSTSRAPDAVHLEAPDAVAEIVAGGGIGTAN